MALRALIGREDVTPYLDGSMTFSNVDPGGFEACQLQFGRRVDPRRADPIRIEEGTAVAWEGRVADPGAHEANSQVVGEGYGARLKDDRMAEIWVDRDFSRWTGPGTARRLAWLNGLDGGASPVDPSTAPDENGMPALLTEITGPWGSASGSALCEAWYDAGEACSIGRVYGAWTNSGPVNDSDPLWTYLLFLSADDSGPSDATVNLRAVDPNQAVVTASGARRHAGVQLRYPSAAGDENVRYGVYWTCLAVYGTHGLPLLGVDTQTSARGLAASDIVRNVVSRVPDVAAGVIADSSEFVIEHLAHIQPTSHEQVIADAASFMPWHWGTWDSGSVLRPAQPRVDFRPYPASATAYVRRSDCDSFDAPERLADLYDRAQVAWQDAAGAQRTTLRTRAVAELAEANLTRTLDIDMGTATPPGAEKFGDYVLELAEMTARSTGSATISRPVDGPAGRRAGHLLRAGLDKLAVPDLPGLPVLDGARREFNLRRVEATANPDGISTNVEFGAGSSLLEVLQARMAAATDRVA